MTVLGNAPEDWRRTTIGEVAEVRLGRQRSPKNHSGNQMRPYLRAANVDWYGLRPDDIKEMNFTEDEMETYALRENDILVVEGSGSATEVGKCALVPERFVGHAFQNTLIRVRAGDDVNPRWLMYRINAEAELGGFLKLARGSGIFHLGSTRTGKWPVAIPPMPEQRAVVETIERMLSYLTSAHGDVIKGLERTDPLRRSVLSRTFRLRHLSADGPGHSLDAPEHWRVTTIGEVAQVRLGRQRSPKNHSGDHMQPYLRAANVDWYSLRPDDVEKMNFTPDEMETYALREDDILVVEGSGSATEVGKCALVPPQFAGHAFQNTLIRVRAGDDVDPRWLMYRINAEAELGGFLTLARGSGIFHLGSTRTGKWRIALPPIPEQLESVSRLDAEFSHIARLHGALQRSANRAQRLRRSVLKEAFSGRLTAGSEPAGSVEDPEEAIA